MELKPGDKIRVTQVVREDTKKKVSKDYKVVQVSPTFITVTNGKYKTSIHQNDIETGEIQIQKI